MFCVPCCCVGASAQARSPVACYGVVVVVVVWSVMVLKASWHCERCVCCGEGGGCDDGGGRGVEG